LSRALREVLANARKFDGLAIGLHECAKTLDRRQAHLCLLATDCENPAYKKLIESLCAEGHIPLLSIDEITREHLGQWCGLVKFDPEHKPRRIVKTSCVVIRNFGVESDGYNFLREYLRDKIH